MRTLREQSARILHGLACWFVLCSAGLCRAETRRMFENMVLPEWIEHSTSPLPRGCSTTELRHDHSGNAICRCAEYAASKGQVSPKHHHHQSVRSDELATIGSSLQET